MLCVSVLSTISNSYCELLSTEEGLIAIVAASSEAETSLASTSGSDKSCWLLYRLMVTVPLDGFVQVMVYGSPAVMS